MIKVISIRHLKSECQTFVFFQIYGKNIGGPSKLVITVHKGEVKQISSGHWVNKERIIFSIEKVIIKIHKQIIFLIAVGSLCALQAHFIILTHENFLRLMLFCFSKLVLNCFRESSFLCVHLFLDGWIDCVV